MVFVAEVGFAPTHLTDWLMRPANLTTLPFRYINKALEIGRATLRNSLPTHRSIIPNLSGASGSRTHDPLLAKQVL